MPTEITVSLPRALALLGHYNIASQDGAVANPQQQPFPWVSISPHYLDAHPEELLKLMHILGAYNRSHMVQWIIRPLEPEGFASFRRYYLLEPVERNEDRSEAVLARLQQEALELAQYLELTAQIYPEVYQKQKKRQDDLDAMRRDPLADIALRPQR